MCWRSLALCVCACSGWAREGSSDLVWQKHIAEWFRDNGVTSSFYWCLNPNSGDTGGEGRGCNQPTAQALQGEGWGSRGRAFTTHVLLQAANKASLSASLHIGPTTEHRECTAPSCCCRVLHQVACCVTPGAPPSSTSWTSLPQHTPTPLHGLRRRCSHRPLPQGTVRCRPLLTQALHPPEGQQHQQQQQLQLLAWLLHLQ